MSGAEFGAAQGIKRITVNAVVTRRNAAGKVIAIEDHGTVASYDAAQPGPELVTYPGKVQFSQSGLVRFFNRLRGKG